MDAGDVAVVLLDAALDVRDAWESLNVLVEDGLLPVELAPQYELLGAVDTALTAFTRGTQGTTGQEV